jgi:acetolactate synthase-1/2/3 large subunit
VKLTDFVAKYLENMGVEVCFMVSGGAVLHLLDSIERNTKIKIVCTQHEQFAATAADSFSRISKSSLGLCVATSGPGATNLVTGISNAFFDSIPMICITGQVSKFREKPSKLLRQYGFQETDVLNIFKPITKYATKISKPEDIKYELGKAFYLATNGRPGPVLIDLPDDLQRMQVDQNKLKTFYPDKIDSQEKVNIKKPCEQVNRLLVESSKPLVVLGSGIRISKSEDLIRRFIEDLNVPFITTWGAKDLFPEQHYLNMGTFGVCGPRYGNWAISECDLLIVLGARLNQMQVGGRIQDFAPNALKIIVDIDKYELNKFKKLGLKIDYTLIFDLNNFLRRIKLKKFNNSKWHSWLLKIKSEYTIISEHQSEPDEINAYKFVDIISDKAKESDVIFTDAGGNLCWTMQAFKVNSNQRLISAWNHSPMGFSLAAAIGAAFSSPRRNIHCIIGDGGLMMCLQELGTLARHNLPINVFVFNNQGHGIQKQTINTWLNGNQIGVDYKSGLFFPDFKLIAESFGISYIKIQTMEQASKILLNNKSPIIYDVMINPEQIIKPMLKFGGNLTDLDDLFSKPDYD